MNEQGLFDLKEEIDTAKQKVSELKGERQALMKQLNENWKCSSLKDAEKKLVVLQKQKDQLTIEEDIKELEEALNESNNES